MFSLRTADRITMLEAENSRVLPDGPVSSVREKLDLALGFLRRRYLALIAGLVVAFIGAAIYLLLAPSIYTATAVMMIDTRKTPALQSSLLGDAPPDSGWIESQIGLLKSQSIAAYLVKQLRLADEPELNGLDRGLVDKVLSRFGWSAADPVSEAERTGNAIGAVLGQLEVQRVGLSYLIRINFRSTNPELASKIANAVVDGYIYDQLNAKYQANRRAGDWLQERLQALRDQAATAERAAIDFKTKNNIVATGGGLMNEQQLADISGQFAKARAQVSDLQIRLKRIQTVRQAYRDDYTPGSPDETVTEEMNNPIISSLRGRYLELMNRAAEWSAKYGESHNAVVNARSQIRAIRSSIRNELERIEQTHKSELEIAQKRQADVEKALSSLITQSTETNQAQVTLFSLDAAAKSYRKLYDEFLQRHTAAVQQQTYPVSDARQVSPAGAAKTSPSPLRVWLLALFGGGLLGIGFGSLREILDRGFRSREQMRAVLEKDCIALVPLLPQIKRRWLLADRQSDLLKIPRVSELEAVLLGQSTARNIRSVPASVREVVHSPGSSFAEAIQSIKLSLDMSALPKKVIGVTSAMASEGKSSIAAALAAELAQRGERVILVDCDIRNPSLSRLLAPGGQVDLLDVLDGRAHLSEAIWTDPNSRMAFLPINRRKQQTAIDVLSSDQIKTLFSTLQIHYDYVVVDLSPLMAATDVRATSRFVNSYLLVVEWGATKAESVQYALRNAPHVYENLIGTVLNKVDVSRLGRYDRYGSQYYYGQTAQRDQRR